MDINSMQAVKLLQENDNILILTHISPDGDTLGSAFGLMYALKQLNKNACVTCSDVIPAKFETFVGKCECDFQPEYIVSVDIASKQLFGEHLMKYSECVNLCIDHHPSNTRFAQNTCLVSKAAATCEIIFEVIKQLNCEITSTIADCLYLGICTDTGCFKYSNVTPNTHITAATLIQCGAQYADINRLFFETKTKNQLAMEREAYKTLEYYYDNKLAIIGITRDMIAKTGVEDSDLDAIATIPRSIEGVEIGITIKQKTLDAHKVSVRTNKYIDASEICAVFGGGGHARAAGCLIKEDYDTSKALLIKAIESFIEKSN